MPHLFRVALFCLVACSGKDAADPSPPVADTDTDTDTDSDTDTDPGTTDTAPPTGPEVCDDGRDNDLDLNTDCEDPDCAAVCDADGDGVASVAAGGLDCDDADPTAYPRAPEVCDGADDDCDGLVDVDDPSLSAEGALIRFFDGDGDGFGDEEGLLCAEASGWLETGGDCDDGDVAVFPGAAEVCNGVDDDCANGADDADPNVDPATQLPFWTDADDDGYGDASLPVLACQDSASIADNPDDCDDGDRRIRPGAVETCGDGIDQDCLDGDLAC